jgi:hypothetical protein
MLIHQLHLEKISLIPSSAFINNLWICEFFWILPDSPSGIRTLYCPEMKSANATEMEKERMLAPNKVNLSDIEKLAKQKLFIPNSVMELVWMTQNLHAVLKLCFSPSAHSSVFLKGWADHMYENRIMYSTFQSADPYFFTKVLFAIDSALLVHWRLCETTDDRMSVNDSILHMSDIQDSILCLSFSQQMPKPSDKILHSLESNKEKDGKYGQGKFI